MVQQNPDADVHPYDASVRLPRRNVIDGKHWALKCTPDSVRSAKQMLPRSDDVFICTYPKSGTTWLQHIVHQLHGKTEYEDVGNGDAVNAMFFVSPQIEQYGAAYTDQLPSPRILKSHLTYDEIPKGGGANYYHHYTNQKILDFEHGDFDVFFELFMSGRVGSGDYFDHLTSWLNGIEQADENILFLKYEDMVADLHSAIVKIGTFLGGKAAEFIGNEDRLASIVEASKFSSMKTNQQRWFPKSLSYRADSFVRKGGSRDWANRFSHEQSLRVDMRFKERSLGTTAAEWWRTEMAWNHAEEDNQLSCSDQIYCPSADVPIPV